MKYWMTKLKMAHRNRNWPWIHIKACRLWKATAWSNFSLELLLDLFSQEEKEPSWTLRSGRVRGEVRTQQDPSCPKLTPSQHNRQHKPQRARVAQIVLSSDRPPTPVTNPLCVQFKIFFRYSRHCPTPLGLNKRSYTSVFDLPEILWNVHFKVFNCSDLNGQEITISPALKHCWAGLRDPAWGQCNAQGTWSLP